MIIITKKRKIISKFSFFNNDYEKIISKKENIIKHQSVFFV